jgi:hypothetical protein
MTLLEIQVRRHAQQLGWAARVVFVGYVMTLLGIQVWRHAQQLGWAAKGGKGAANSSQLTEERRLDQQEKQRGQGMRKSLYEAFVGILSPMS